MFSKITIIAIVAFVATTDGSKVWDGYSARWADDPTQGFRQLPTTYSQATKGGWTRVIDTKLPRGVMLLCYDHDVTFGLLFSIRTSKVVGHQIALPAADLDNSCSPIDYNGKPGFTKKIYNRQYYYAALAMYAEDEEKGRQISIEMNGKFVKIPTKYDQVLSKTSYYSKQCVKWMGHHFYQVNSTTGIHDFPPWAFLSVGEDIIGIVFQAIGKVSTSGYIKWFENVDTSKTADVIPDACTELKEGIQKYGLISLHIYFKKNPVQIVCRDKCTAVYNGTDTSNSCPVSRKRQALGSGNVC